MFKKIFNFTHSLGAKLIIAVGLILLVIISTWAFFDIRQEKQKAMTQIIASTDRLTHAVRLGTHYAMMLNSRDEINQIINNIGRVEEIENIRIYNKEGKIKFSNRVDEVEQTTNIKAEACHICHHQEPPLAQLALEKRTRIIQSESGLRLLGIITPIYNEPSCSTDACHVHPADKQVLGALDLVVSLKQTDMGILKSQKGAIGLAAIAFLITSAFIFFFVLKFVNHPIRRLIDVTRRIAKGESAADLSLNGSDEIGLLTKAVNQMGDDIANKQYKLNLQRDEYQNLFGRVPCLITVQDKNYKLLQYNREFEEKFDPQPGQFCYQAYKGRDEKCIVCPVEKTFETGMSHTSEEAGVSKDGSPTHWIVKTTPVKNERGEVVAAMEMSLDITERKLLEEELNKSEQKYHAIFYNIPNPVFVLDVDSLEILDCNERVHPVYGYLRDEIIGRSFLELFHEDERSQYEQQLKSLHFLNQVKHIHQSGRTLYVNIRVSLSEYPGQKVLLVTTSDITKRLEAEQQLIQASKMATLGEMATGVAHELNQPLAVIKTASSFFMKKINKDGPIKDEILFEMAKEIDSHVDRATKIINHMRQFGRKSELKAEPVQVNDVMQRAFEIFSQQLKVRGIDVVWEIQEELPEIMADAGRLEQVFINLLINARDAIEQRDQTSVSDQAPKRITLKTTRDDGGVRIEVCDSGSGIPKNILNKIFEPFFTTKRVGKGTGLGLSISYGIVKDYGGTLEAASSQGEGTCFTIKFPRISETGEP